METSGIFFVDGLYELNPNYSLEYNKLQKDKSG